MTVSLTLSGWPQWLVAISLLADALYAVHMHGRARHKVDAWTSVPVILGFAWILGHGGFWS